MIKVTNLAGEPFLLNAELVRYVEARPDTFITTVPGERIVVRESLDEVLRLCLEYQRAKHWIPVPQTRVGDVGSARRPLRAAAASEGVA